MSTLTTDEIKRIGAELGIDVLAPLAFPYAQAFTSYMTIILDYVQSSDVAAVTSSTTVSSAGPTLITPSSTTGFVAGMKIVLDCDASRETVTLRAVVGGAFSVVCRKTHSGTYPIEVESGLTLVRGLLSDLVLLEEIERDGWPSLGLKKVDEVEWFGASEGGDLSQRARAARAAGRDRLAVMVGLTDVLNAQRAMQSGGGAFEVW